LLSLRKGTIVTKEMFLNHLYGGLGEPELKIIDVFVSNLPKNIAQATGGEHYIETVWGRGYVLRDPTPPDLPDLTRMPLQRLVVNPNRRLTKWLGERRRGGRGHRRLLREPEPFRPTRRFQHQRPTRHPVEHLEGQVRSVSS